jgi:putative oxidoreductase
MGTNSDFARLVLRGTVGGAMLAHGLKHAKTLEGTAGWFKSIGFSQPDLQAKASAAAEIGSGAALLAGLGTPYAASAVIGTMGVAAGAAHLDNGYFITSSGYEYNLALSAAAAAIASMGPGTLSIDRLFGKQARLTGWTGGVFAIVIGLAAASAHLKAFWTKPVPVITPPVEPVSA